MSRLWLCLASALAHALAAEESEPILGDLAELGKSDEEVFLAVLGLVVRRQLETWRERWRDGRQWFVLFAMVVPGGLLLTTLASQLGQSLSPILLMWFHHGIRYETGVSPAALLTGLGLQAAALTTWSWITGTALRRFYPQAAWLNGAFFMLLCLFCSWFEAGTRPAPAPLARTLLPLNVLLVLLPACLGFFHRRPAIGRWPGRTVPVVWTVLVGCLAWWAQCWYPATLDNWSQGNSPLTLLQLAVRADVWQQAVPHLLEITVLAGPVLYLLRKRSPEIGAA